ncbi:MAG TPA: phosphotriesterase-related protein [Actinomycetales bacterium]|nr:phosphotriesterase-related protein [Actinomycetales bacterium]
MTQVMTVRGPVDSSELGVTMTHEHIFNDVTSWWHPTSSRGWDPDDLAARPVTTDLLWDLRQDPFANRDNCILDDEELAVNELARYAAHGGSTVIDATGLGLGRDLARLRRVSERTGVTIIAGTGFYLDAAQPAEVKGLAPEQIAEIIVRDIQDGQDGVRPGIIGEIGVSADFTPAERASLHGAFIAQRHTGLPVQVHLPGWFRRGDEVLDVAEDLGVDPRRVVLCHMGPSGDDLDYQERLLRRGAYVQYDMIGMEVFYADQGVQCPSDEQNALWLCRLAERGHLDQLLVSQDIFLKSLLRHYGGPGYAHILQYFVPRLLRLGMAERDIDHLLVDNPRAIFDATHEKEN